MPLPSDFYEEDVNYRIRLCMLVEGSDVSFVVAGSKINPCDGCGELIWVNETQEIPPLPDGMPLTGDVSLCRNCMAEVYKKVSLPDGPEFIDALPPEVQEEAKRYFGMTPP